jgi:hypothetical protein
VSSPACCGSSLRQGSASVAVIVTINVIGGFVQIVDSPARQAFVGRLVVPADLASAVSLNGVVVNTARVVGPAVAGALIVTVGTTPCFAVNAVSYMAVVIALLTVHPLADASRSARLKGAVRDGLRYARGRQQLWLPLVMMALVGLLAFNFAVILPVMARKTFHGSGGTYGLMATMLSLGSIAGSLGVGLVRHPRRPLLVAAALAFGASLALTAGAPNVPLVCAALVITGRPRSPSSPFAPPPCSCTRPPPTAVESWPYGSSSTSGPRPSGAFSPGGSPKPEAPEWR